MSEALNVEVAYALPQRQRIVRLEVRPGTTVAEAISASGIRDLFPEIGETPDTGIFSRKVSLDQELREGDRVEIYRPLIADPKQVRRQKAEREKAERKGKR